MEKLKTRQNKSLRIENMRKTRSNKNINGKKKKSEIKEAKQ